MFSQANDILIYRDRQFQLASFPLEAYLSERCMAPDLFGRCAAWRGYVATWTVDDGWLFLSSLAGSWADGASLQLQDLFPVTGARTFAAWHSGELRAWRAEGRLFGRGAPDLILQTHCGRLKTSSMIHRPRLVEPSNLALAEAH
jgi:hypothetical protein